MEYPYFPLYVQNWMIGTMKMTAEEKGGYLNLLIHQWDKGFIPAENSELEEISGVKSKKLLKILTKFQKTENGTLQNRRLEEVRAEVAAKFTRNRSNGAKGGRPSAKKIDENNNPSVNSGYPTANPEETQTEPNKNKSKSKSKSKIDNTIVLSAHAENFARPEHAPSIQAIEEIFMRMGRPEMAQGFFDYYEGLGWMVGHTKLVNPAPFANRWAANPIAQKQQAAAATGRTVIMEHNGGEVPWSEEKYKQYCNNPNASGYHFVRYE
jgi:uncharacterized protein YdaU (DUF1376 family)